MIELDLFVPHLLPYISEFHNLRSLAVCNTRTLAAVRSLVAAWPEEVREFLATWCTEMPEPFVFARVPEYRRSKRGERELHRAVIRFDAGVLRYDLETHKLLGQPWSKVYSFGKSTENDESPNNHDAAVCFADDDKTQLFFCGGTFRIPDEDEGYGYTFHPSRDAALLDIASGEWTDLPMMSKSRGAASRGGPAAAAFRVRSKIYVFGGCNWNGRSLKPLCFNLEKKKWVNARLHDFPGEPYDYMRTLVLDDRRVIVSTGCILGFSTSEWWMQVFLLDVSTGEWEELPDLPRYAKLCSFSGMHPDQIAVAFAGEYWASLHSSDSPEWVQNPDFRGTALKAFSFSDSEDCSEVKVFVGNSFLSIPEVRINGKAFTLTESYAAH